MYMAWELRWKLCSVEMHLLTKTMFTVWGCSWIPICPMATAIIRNTFAQLWLLVSVPIVILLQFSGATDNFMCFGYILSYNCNVLYVGLLSKSIQNFYQLVISVRVSVLKDICCMQLLTKPSFRCQFKTLTGLGPIHMRNQEAMS